MPGKATGDRSTIGVVILPENLPIRKRKTAVFLNGGALPACVRCP
ncbi:hypothetical protein J2W80_006604 [Methylorubrum extorquens]|nr:hypothetical protein [Methylorubrum extorquens]MCP1592044.1 hypothetical protein [Methylorubrum extorquens]